MGFEIFIFCKPFLVARLTPLNIMESCLVGDSLLCWRSSSKALLSRLGGQSQWNVFTMKVSFAITLDQQRIGFKFHS